MKFFNNLPRLSLETVGWILVLGFLAYRMAPQVKAAFGAGSGGSMAPTLVVDTFDHGHVELSDFRGQVVLVNFWATWCPPCRLEMPGFQRVYEDRRDDGFVVLALSTDRGDPREVREFLSERELTFPAAFAGDAAREFGGVRMLPTSFLIDRQGRVRQEVTGLFTEPMLRLAVGRLLAEEASAEGDIN